MRQESLNNLKSLPYNPRMAEHAQKIRKALLECHEEGYILAVDLPHGLEEQIGKTVKRLPRISLILDELNRAIPVVPSNGSIEAVRTAKALGMRTEFMDASLPFIQDQVSYKELFSSLSAHINDKKYEALIEHPYSEYMDLRRRYMALRVRELMNEGEKVMMVCNFTHHAAVINKMHRRIEFGCGVVSPSIICHVDQHDIWKISSEIPYFLTIYELSRQKLNFDRKKALIKLFYDDENKINVSDILRYSRNLAIGDGQIYPDIFNIISSAKLCGDDEYALKVLYKALSYPFTEEKTSCKFGNLFDFDLQAIKGQGVLKIKTDLIKEAERYINPELRYKRNNNSMGVKKLKRPPEDLEKELRFAQYLMNNYQNYGFTDDYDSEEFQCGFYEGLDLRQTLRYKFMDKIYVKKQGRENNAAYVINFGGVATHTIYFDTQSSVVGAAHNSGANGNSSHPDGLCWNCFTLFANTPEGGTEKMLNRINIFNPLSSCLQLALENANHVFLFSKEPIPPQFTPYERSKIRLMGISKIPKKLLEGMRCFHLRWMND